MTSDKHTSSDIDDEIREVGAPAPAGMSAHAQQLLNGGAPPFRWASLWEPAGEPRLRSAHQVANS